MNVWLVTIGEPLPLEPGVRKHRTGMLADAFLNEGHFVHWWTSAYEHQRKFMLFDEDREIIQEDGLVLHILRGCGYSKNVSVQRYVDHRLIAQKFRVSVKKAPPPDVVIASMPCYHLAFEAVQYAKKRKIPVFVDIRDLWPDIFVDHLGGQILRRLGTIGLYFEFKRLQKTLAQADGLIAVSENYLRWALRYATRSACPDDRVFFLGCHQSNPDNTSLDRPPWLKGREHQKLLLFIGSFGLSYELDILVKAAKQMQQTGRRDICFVIAGAGEQDSSLRMAASDLPNVIFPGWINGTEISSLLKAGYVGLLPYVKGAPQGIPNKPFEYLSAGLPIVSSLEGEMSDMIDRHGIGLNYKPGDLNSLCHIIQQLVDKPTLHKRFSSNAISFFNAYGNAESIYKDYATHVEKGWLRIHGNGSVGSVVNETTA
jgi:glycosyltransferase involved in cell wall biosynthesis